MGFFDRLTDRSQMVTHASAGLTFNDHPEIVAARKKVANLEEKRAELERARIECRRAAFEAREAYSAQADRRMDDAARAVAGGGPAIVPTLDPERRAAELDGELQVLERAINMARQGAVELERPVCLTIAEPFKARHRRAVRQVAHALAMLEQAQDAEGAARDELVAAGLGSFVQVHDMSFTPARSVTTGPASIWMEAARRLGYLRANESPFHIAPGGED